MGQVVGMSLPLRKSWSKLVPSQSISKSRVPPLLLRAAAFLGSAASKSARGVPAANESAMSSTPVNVAPAVV